MITNERYFALVEQAIHRASLPLVQQAIATIRADALEIQRAKFKKNCFDHKAVGRMSCLGLIDVRGQDDITPLMLACLLYRQKVVEGDRRAAEALNGIAAWLLKEGASVGLEGHRPAVRTIDRTTGQPVYVRGRGLNLMNAMGWANLPPSVQFHIQPRRLVKEIRGQRMAVAA